MLLFDNFVNTVYFNPLPRKEGDRAYTQGKKHHRNFNPLPRKEGDLYIPRIFSSRRNFNPLPRKEGDYNAAVDGRKPV